MAVILGMSIYILSITKDNEGCADKIGVDTDFLDTINIGIISIMSMFIIYKIYFHFKNKGKGSVSVSAETSV